MPTCSTQEDETMWKIASLLLCVAFALTGITVTASAQNLLRLCRGNTTSVSGDPLTGAYLGKFVQAPGDESPHALVVKSNKKGKAEVYYAWGAWKKYGIRAGCVKVAATVKKNTLKVKFPSGNRVQYNFFPKDGFATVTYKSPNGTTRGRVEKKN